MGDDLSFRPLFQMMPTTARIMLTPTTFFSLAPEMLAAALEVEEARQAGMAQAGEALLKSVTTADWCLVRRKRRQWANSFVDV